MLAVSFATLISPVGLAGAPARAQMTIECAGPAAASSPTSAAEMAATPAAMEAEFPEGGGNVTVFAAASLTDAFGKMKTDLEAAHPGLTITYNFTGSQALVTQLKEGAQADVFASANNAQMQAAIDNGSISGEPGTFIHNRLAVITPADNPAGIDSPADLRQDGLRLILAQAEVPVGKYARESLCKMGRDTATYGEDFVAHVAANIVSEEEDVRDVLAKVELGEADAGIVYVSDANAGKDQVKLIDIPNDVNVVATYPIAGVTAGNAELGDAFIAYVLSPEGQSTLEDYGFEPLAD
jgi:molybdate transport system substrate-binding protein